MKIDNQLNSQLDECLDYVHQQVQYLFIQDETENARAVLMEWEELIRYEEGDDIVEVEWMKSITCPT